MSGVGVAQYYILQTNQPDARDMGGGGDPYSTTYYK